MPPRRAARELDALPFTVAPLDFPTGLHSFRPFRAAGSGSLLRHLPCTRTLIFCRLHRLYQSYHSYHLSAECVCPSSSSTALESSAIACDCSDGLCLTWQSAQRRTSVRSSSLSSETRNWESPPQPCNGQCHKISLSSHPIPTVYRRYQCYATVYRVPASRIVSIRFSVLVLLLPAALLSIMLATMLTVTGYQVLITPNTRALVLSHHRLSPLCVKRLPWIRFGPGTNVYRYLARPTL